MAMDVVRPDMTNEENAESETDAGVPEETETAEDRRKHEFYKIWKKKLELSRKVIMQYQDFQLSCWQQSMLV